MTREQELEIERDFAWLKIQQMAHELGYQRKRAELAEDNLKRARERITELEVSRGACV